jgi:hypothetical protein
MNESTQGIGAEFWLALVIALFCAVVTLILFKRKHWWVRCLDAEETFWERFGLPKSKGMRAFFVGRSFAISFAICTVLIFLMLAVDFVLYLKLKRQRMEMERHHRVAASSVA